MSKVDVYALGVILVSMLTGMLKPPIPKGIDYLLSLISEDSSNNLDLKDLLSKTLASNPQDRSSLESLKNHKWLKNDLIADQTEIQDFFGYKELVKLNE